jgi:hypothetical protein
VVAIAKPVSVSLQESLNGQVNVGGRAPSVTSDEVEARGPSSVDDAQDDDDPKDPFDV